MSTGGPKLKNFRSAIPVATRGPAGRAPLHGGRMAGQVPLARPAAAARDVVPGALQRRLSGRGRMEDLAPLLTITPDAQAVIMGDTVSDGPSGGPPTSEGSRALTAHERRCKASRDEAMAMLVGEVPGCTEIDWEDFQKVMKPPVTNVTTTTTATTTPNPPDGSPDTSDMDPFRDQEEVEIVDRPEAPAPSQHVVPPVTPLVTSSLRVIPDTSSEAPPVALPKDLSRRTSRIPTPSRAVFSNNEQQMPYTAPRRYSRPLDQVYDTVPPTRFPPQMYEQILKRHLQSDDTNEKQPALPLRMSAIPTSKKDRSRSKARLAMSKVGRLLHPKRDSKVGSKITDTKTGDTKTKVNFADKPQVVPSRHAEHHAPLHRVPSQQPTSSAFAHHGRSPGVPNSPLPSLPRSVMDKKLPVLPPHTQAAANATKNSTSPHVAPLSVATPAASATPSPSQPASEFHTPTEKETKAMATYMLQQTSTMAPEGRKPILDITSAMVQAVQASHEARIAEERARQAAAEARIHADVTQQSLQRICDLVKDRGTHGRGFSRGK